MPNRFLVFLPGRQAETENDTQQNIMHGLCVHAYLECRNERNSKIKESADANTVEGKRRSRSA